MKWKEELKFTTEGRTAGIFNYCVSSITISTKSFPNPHLTFLGAGSVCTVQKGRLDSLPRFGKSADRSGRHKSGKLSLESLAEWFLSCQAVSPSSGPLGRPSVFKKQPDRTVMSRCRGHSANTTWSICKNFRRALAIAPDQKEVLRKKGIEK